MPLENTLLSATEQPLSSEKEKANSIETKQSEEEQFIASFDLSPEQQGNIKQYLRKLHNPKTTPLYINREGSNIPEEVKKSDLVKNLAKQVFYNSIVQHDGVGTGKWIEYKKDFGIEESFFTQKDFNEYKRSNWLERISYGYQFNDPSRFTEDSWGNDNNIKSQKLEEELSLGTMNEVGITPDMVEVKTAAAKGVITKVLSTSFTDVNNKKKVIEEYTNFFHLTSQDLEEALSAKKIVEASNLKHFDTLRTEFTFIDEYLKNPETRQKAKESAQKLFISLQEHDAEKVADYFSIPIEEFDMESMRRQQKEFAIGKIRESFKKKDPHLFYTLEHNAKYTNIGDLKALYQDESLHSQTVQAIAQGLQHDWQLDKNLSFLKSIEVPEEIIHEAGIKALQIKISTERFRNSTEDLSDFCKKINLSTEGILLGASLAIIELIDMGENMYDIERFKKEFGILKLANTPKIQKKEKEVYLKKVASAHEYQLELMENAFDIQWSPEDISARKNAVKNMLLDNHRLGNFYDSEQLNKYIKKYYPERHTLFLLTDPEVQQSIEKKLLSEVHNQFNENKAARLIDFASYFNIPIEKISQQIRQEISGGGFVSPDPSMRKIYKTYLHIDLDTENKLSVEKYGDKMITESFEKKDWERIKDIIKYATPEQSSRIQEMIAFQEANLKDKNKSFEIRSYALEASASFSEQKGAYATLLKNWEGMYGVIKNLSKTQFEEKIETLETVTPFLTSKFFKDIPFQQTFEIIESYSPQDQVTLTNLNELETTQKPLTDFEKNWAEQILRYVDSSEDAHILKQTPEDKQKILNLFSSDYKDTALRSLQNKWQEFLGSSHKYLPPELYIISKLIDTAGGAGNLKHIESIGNLIHEMDKTLMNPKTLGATKTEVQTLLSAQEKRFEKEKWSQDERSEFYNLSRDIMEAAPSLYSSFSPIFESISPKEMKGFMKEVFPFYQAQLVIIQEINGDQTTYKPRELVEVRSSLRQLAQNIKTSPEASKALFEEERLRLLEIVKDGFKERFGLMKVPEEFTKEHLRSIQNGIRYMGNINGRNSEREAIIALYLGLELNGQWDAFRQGKSIILEDYFSGKQLETLKPLLEQKKKSHELLAKTADISPEQMPRFQEILQDETMSSMIGNIQTVDVKLGNIKRNIEELTDPDIYETQFEKDVMTLLMNEGKKVGSVLAKTYSEVSGKPSSLTPEERELQHKIGKIFGINSWNASGVKKVQDSIQPLSLVTNMITKMEQEKVDESIEELQKRLVPTEEIIAIFNRLGEEFKQESGAFALSKDITYLENLLVKDDKKITPEERKIVEKYLGDIKEKMIGLEKTLDKVREYFDKVNKSSHLENHPILKSRLSEIEKIMYATDSNALIVSRMTKDLNLIIENMRQCLGCMRKEINNDTNLAFGDYNKFFMINQSEKEKGSISDEIVFFVPTKNAAGIEGMSFVLDRVYGSKSSDVLVGNILSVYKKYQTLKKQSPNAKISLSVTNEAMASVGLNADVLKKRLSDVSKDIISSESLEDLVAVIPKSSFSDNYVEFGDKTAREIGERKFKGLVLH